MFMIQRNQQCQKGSLALKIFPEREHILRRKKEHPELYYKNDHLTFLHTSFLPI